MNRDCLITIFNHDTFCRITKKLLIPLQFIAQLVKWKQDKPWIFDIMRQRNYKYSATPQEVDQAVQHTDKYS